MCSKCLFSKFKGSDFHVYYGNQPASYYQYHQLTRRQFESRLHTTHSHSPCDIVGDFGLCEQKDTNCENITFASYFFFLKFLADTCPFLGPLVPLFWISGDVSSGFQSSGLPYSHCRGERKVRSPRSTSGATHHIILCMCTVMTETQLTTFHLAPCLGLHIKGVVLINITSSTSYNYL